MTRWLLWCDRCATSPHALSPAPVGIAVTSGDELPLMRCHAHPDEWLTGVRISVDRPPSDG